MSAQMRASSETFAASFLWAAVGPVAGMCAQVLGQVAVFGKPPAAGRPGAQKVFFAAVNVTVTSQMTALHKALAAVGIRAGKGPVGVPPFPLRLMVMLAQVLFPGEQGPEPVCAAGVGTGEGEFSGMTQLVRLQDIVAKKGPRAAFIRADKEFCTVMDTQMTAEGAFLAKGFVTVFVPAGKGSFSRMGAQVFAQFSRRGKLFATVRVPADHRPGFGRLRPC